MRSLLSASVISVSALDGSELPMDGGEDSSAEVDATEVGSLPGAPIDPDFTEITPGDHGADDAIFYCGIADGDKEAPVEDPLMFIRFNTLFTSDDSGTDGEKPVVDDADVAPDIYFSLNPDDAVVDGDVVVDGDPVDGEKVTVDESVIYQNLPPVEGWDPSWVYRTLTPAEGDGSEEIIVDQGTSWEDGLGCGVAPDGFFPGDVPINDLDGDGMPDDFVMYPFDPLALEDDPGKPMDVIDNGRDFEPDGGELIPIRTLESSDFDPSVIYFTAAPGGVEVQRTNDAGNIPEESAAPSTVVIPVRSSSANSLFNANSGRSSVGIPAGVQSNLTPGSNSSPTKRNATQRRSTTQVAATRQSAASEGLNSLSPLLGGETAPDENDSPENSVDTQAVQSESIEETVSDSGNAISGASGFAANQNVQPRSSRAAMIDRVMAQYAENSFNS